MQLRSRISAAIASVALVGGVGLATAVPAQAGTATKTLTAEHASRGLGGNLTVADSQSVGKQLYNGESTVGNYGSGNLPKSVRAGGGYCVWEELFYVSNSGAWTKDRDYNWGKSQPEGTWSVLQGYLHIQNDHSRNWKSVLSIYAC